MLGIPTVGIIGGIVIWIIAGTRANKAKEKSYLHKGWIFIGYEGEINKNISIEE